MLDKIIIKGARVHNLKNISLEIPKNKLVVITGLSGSGKSSLAFDTIYAEGQRRYVESLSSYARQFLGIMEKPDVESIEGLSPAIAIDQKTTSKNPRSTVGTVTEIYDYLRVLYARIGVPYCPNCNIVIEANTIDQITDEILSYPDGEKIQILSPVVVERKGEYKKLLERLSEKGFVRVRIDGQVFMLGEENIELDKNKKHTIEIIVDRIKLRKDQRSRISEDIEIAVSNSNGIIKVIRESGEEKIYSTLYSCVSCGFSLQEMHPRLFSFNSPIGACPECHGLGVKYVIDPSRVIDYDLSINDNAIKVILDIEGSKWYKSMFIALAKHYNFSLDRPLRELGENIINMILYGSDEEIEFEVKGQNSSFKTRKMFEGIIPMIERRYSETTSEAAKEYYESFMKMEMCPVCKGDRLKKEALYVKLSGLSIIELSKKTIKEIYDFISNLNLNEKGKIIGGSIINEILNRLKFLLDVGLDYITLHRQSSTLSGGESQRIRLATQIGTKLTGVLYVLDEPTIGLHQRDNEKLIAALKELRDIGNTLIVVEHDEDTIRESDYIIDMGPGAGENGGYVVAAGNIEQLMKSEESLTGKYLSGKIKIEVPSKRREGNGSFIEIKNVRTNNLKNISVRIPLGIFVAVTGVSGSGKSSFVIDTLVPAIKSKINTGDRISGDLFFDEIEIGDINKLIEIDQSPIGRTPRSNPATYTKVFDLIRDVFANTKEAKIKGYKPGRFSFNVKGGRCEACKGDGVKKIEMQFLPDVYIKCDVCNGKRFNKETLDVMYKGKNIYEVLEMSVDEAIEHFENHPQIVSKLKTLQEVGLGYIKLGQNSTTLSGGEAQRIKLSRELSKRDTGKTLYILDEPTTGLHFADVSKLINVLNKLVDKGNTVLVIEHNLDVIKSCDYIIDLGPEGGDKGGFLVAEGTPEEVAKNKNSYTGQFLKKFLF
ncbi:MAG TPA: excinuclease ABC subunit UvrA [Spirochaetota bacterium]|nr:excinuclease ABC subunit UvrA [Spirochaetota bacterium]